MYFIFFQSFDDMDHHSSDSLKGIEEYMKNCHIEKDDVILIKGEMLSGMNNKHWPKKTLDK